MVNFIVGLSRSQVREGFSLHFLAEGTSSVPPTETGRPWGNISLGWFTIENIFFRRQNSRDRQSFSQERREDRQEENDCADYDDDKFEAESEKSPSETGTYTVDKEDPSPSPIPASLQESRLPCLASNKTSYVEEWATKHAFSVSRNMSHSSSDHILLKDTQSDHSWFLYKSEQEWQL